ncbi:VOC family protein [Pseudoalteromonas luteoviolacea]|uniref:VOC family protein n=1 Tax=Pseudoalteromonas luteoviolacea TaxID=43657 RepID=UPI001F1BE6F3|nr:VOC family protein [Pseudoalteromonas luteoviolacea]MCF6440060.1 VOC family protein [Pseudoalteromonas luteoviolacea]
MAKMIHSMIRVQDLSKSVQFYHELFDLEVKRQVDFDGFSLTYLANEETSFELELTHNYDNEKAYELGNGYGHLAFSSEDIETIWRIASLHNYDPSDIKSLRHKDTLVARFFFVADPDGYQVEVIEKSEVYF